MNPILFSTQMIISFPPRVSASPVVIHPSSYFTTKANFVPLPIVEDRPAGILLEDSSPAGGEIDRGCRASSGIGPGSEPWTDPISFGSEQNTQQEEEARA